MSIRWKIALLGIVVIAVAVFGLSLVNVTSGENVSTRTVLDVPAVDDSGFARAIEPYDWRFPQDFGAHPTYQTEWWYYTGNLATDKGRRFGFQFTIFRRAITPQEADSDSEWRTNQIYMAHFTLSNVAANEFYHEQRLSRGGAGLAGASVDSRYRVWLEDWQILAQNEDASIVTIQAEAGEFALDLALQQTKPPALQGNNGLSHKGEDEGNASYYYSLSRLLTDGTVTVHGETFTVSGYSWKDHEFSTSALGDGAQGWDWFGLIFDNETEVMLGKIRLNDGSREAAFGGLLIYPDGSTEYLPSGSFTITPTDTWTSPHTGAEYPSGWDITVEAATGTFSFHAEPLLRDQELADSDPAYWEGAVRITGDVTGYGYAELTGYASSMQNRF